MRMILRELKYDFLEYGVSLSCFQARIYFLVQKPLINYARA